MDDNADEEHSNTHEEPHRGFWIGGLPSELWLCILDHLCPHCHPTPLAPLRTDAVFTPAHVIEESGWIPAPLPSISRDALLAVSMTCRLFRDMAQQFVCHRAGPLKLSQFPKFQRTIQARSDLANSVREMSVSSRLQYRSILGHLTNIRTLNYRIMCSQPEDPGGNWSLHSQHVPDVKFGDTTLVGQLERLHSLRLTPPSSTPPRFVDLIRERLWLETLMKAALFILRSTKVLGGPKPRFVDLIRGRLWLETLMKAAPNLRDLSLYYFVDFCFTEDTAGRTRRDLFFQPNAFPNYSGLPDNKITKLHLVRPWFRYHTLEQLLSNFKHLREFGLSRTRRERITINGHRMFRPVDGQDVVTLLKPFKGQLEVLELDFDHYPVSSTVMGRFRPVPSLAGFTALKSLKLGRRSIEPPLFDFFAAHTAAGGDRQKMDELRKAFCDVAKDFLVDMLPRRSLEFLQIDNAFWEKDVNHAMGELARRKEVGEFPSLKRVRILGDVRRDLNAVTLRGWGRYQHLKRFVPEKYWGRAQVVVLRPQIALGPSLGASSVHHDAMEMSNGESFRKAGVLFESIAVTWFVGAEQDGEPNDGQMAVYLEPRYKSQQV